MVVAGGASFSASRRLIAPLWKGCLRRLYGTGGGPKSLHDFMPKTAASVEAVEVAALPPYLAGGLSPEDRPKRRVFIETYGCQMNFNDTEIVLGVLEKSGGYEVAKSVDGADIVLLMTCAIRENAEAKIWQRLDVLNAIEKRKKGGMTVGVLGCMAERVKTELMERKRNVDIVCGPDAYRDLPRLLEDALGGINGINVILSADETYADIAPVRLAPSKKSAFVSIMRGCNNMGRERSRPVESILEEVRRLSDQGVREVTLLGQNVNSYLDESSASTFGEPEQTGALSRGFKTVYKPKVGGRRFADLLDQVSRIDPNMRIRFTSPHPKDFPDSLLHLMRDRANVCKHIHLPAQSGSSAVLERMRRGYTREAYLELVHHIRAFVPNVALSSDFIVGFCGETEQDHRDSLSLIEEVGYDMAYMFAYSMREKTMAHRRYVDDVPAEAKQQRLSEMVALFYSILNKRAASTVGREELVLVEGPSKKSEGQLCGRIDNNRMVVFPKEAIPDPSSGQTRIPEVGDYVRVEIVGSHGATPVATPVSLSSIVDFAHEQQLDTRVVE